MNMDRYDLRRYALMVAVSRENPPKCYYCGTTEYDTLEFHHPDDDRGQGNGGVQMLREVEEDIKQGHSVVVACEKDHKEKDPSRGGMP